MARNSAATLSVFAQPVIVLIGFFVLTSGAVASTTLAFGPPVNYGSGGFFPVSIAVADLNGDGKPDLVVGNLSDGRSQERFLGVLLGNGDGTFRPVVPYDTGGLSLSSGDLTSISIVIADVNGDGNLDLIASNQGRKSGGTEGSVAVLLGNGDGTFQPALTYDSGGQFASSVAVADLNGDGKPDVVVANCAPITSSGCQDGNGVLGVLLGNGNGTFQPVQTYDSGSPELFSSPVLIADINNDGKPDLLIANAGRSGGPGSVGVLLGKGDGSFKTVVTYSSGGEFAISEAVADVNGDGKPDLVVGNFDGPVGVGVLLGNGDGTFQPAKTYSAGQAFSVVITDLNGDDKLDLITANFPNSASLLLGNGDGTFRTPQMYLTGRLEAPLAIADVNGDGRPDLIAANECADEVCGNISGRISVLLNNGDGTFQPAVVLDSGGNLAWSVTTADVNGDGRPDLIVANYDRSSVAVLLNNTPFCTIPPVITISTTPPFLWPPNGKMVPVVVSGTITDTGCTVTTAGYSVTDEYGEVQPSGPVTLGAGGSYSFPVLLRASRIGTDTDGRRYVVSVRAEDSAGNVASKASVVTVLHDQGK